MLSSLLASSSTVVLTVHIQIRFSFAPLADCGEGEEDFQLSLMSANWIFTWRNVCLITFFIAVIV